MKTKNKIPIRLLRQAQWYWIDKAVMSRHGQRLKASGIALYNALAFFANAKTAACYPSQKVMAEMIGMSKRTVRRNLKLLEGLKLVKVEKRKGSSLYYLLKLEPRGAMVSPRVDKKDPGERTGGTPNNNYLTKINERIIGDKNLSGFNSKIPRAFKPKTREELLALDLAKGLDDPAGWPLYLFYARKFSESLLRRTLSEVKATPPKTIKKSKGALFNHLIQKHVKETPHHSGH